jgi:hypothetical protein
MNIFEGSRRIAKVIAGVWAIGTASSFQNEIKLLVFTPFFKVLLGGLAFIWVFTWVVGWIVRGFRGIPRGQDSKSVENDSK